MKNAYVYIMARRSRTLYTGVTNNLESRVAEHQRHLAPGLTSRYRIEWFVYFEVWGPFRDAKEREKQIMGWRRSKKVALIESMNPTWADVSESWFGKADSSARNRPQNDVCGGAPQDEERPQFAHRSEQLEPAHCSGVIVNGCQCYAFLLDNIWPSVIAFLAMAGGPVAARIYSLFRLLILLQTIESNESVIFGRNYILDKPTVLW